MKTQHTMFGAAESSDAEECGTMPDAAMVESSDAEDAVSRNGLVYGSPPRDDDYTFDIVLGSDMLVADGVMNVKASWLRSFVCGHGSGTQCAIGVDLEKAVLHLTSGSTLVQEAEDDELVPLLVHRDSTTRDILVRLTKMTAPECGGITDVELRHGLNDNAIPIQRAFDVGERVYLKFNYLNRPASSRT